LASLFISQLMRVENLVMGVNYGCDKVRFPAPVKVGSRVRGNGLILKAERVGDAVQLAVRLTVEIEGQDKPGCVADTLARFVFMPGELRFAACCRKGASGPFSVCAGAKVYALWRKNRRSSSW